MSIQSPVSKSGRKAGLHRTTHATRYTKRILISLLAALMVFMQLATAGFATENAGGGGGF